MHCRSGTNHEECGATRPYWQCAMTSDATQAIWAHTGSNHTGLKIPSNSFVMMCGVLVAQIYRETLDKEPDAKGAAAHWRSVMSYLRDQQQYETRAGRPSRYDRQAIPVHWTRLNLQAIPRAEARALVLVGASIWPENYGREALAVDATTFKLAPLMTHQCPSEVIYQTSGERLRIVEQTERHPSSLEPVLALVANVGMEIPPPSLGVGILGDTTYGMR
ncbi:hypothetical protein VTO73DRAFT_15078 [Trametes versicolor]